jgi:hypothetical protein
MASATCGGAGAIIAVGLARAAIEQSGAIIAVSLAGAAKRWNPASGPAVAINLA